jgi:hypothetical protein
MHSYVILYNYHRMLVIVRHVSTHLPSYPQTLLNVRLFTVKYFTVNSLKFNKA